MATVFIGVDPHKLSVTIEVVDDRERVWATGPVRHRQGRLRRDAQAGAGLAGAGLGGRGQQRRRPSAGAAAARRRRARRGRPGEAVGPGPAARHRPQPQDRRARRARGRGGRGPHQRAAGAVLRRRARGAADAGRPPRGAVPDAGADRQPVAAAAVRADPRKGEEGPDRVAGQGDPRFGPPAGPRRQDPATARGRAADRAGRGRQEDQGPHQGAQGDRAVPRVAR